MVMTATQFPAAPIAVSPAAGLAGFLCEVTAQPVAFKDCLNCAQHGAPGCPFHPAIISDIINGIRDPEYANQLAKQSGAEVGFSVTEIIGCPRQFALKKRFLYYEKVSAMYRMNFGSGVHAALSKYMPELGYRESTLTWKFQMGGKHILLTGTPDLFEYRDDGWHITDYKVTVNPPFGRKVPVCANCGADLRKIEEDRFTCPTCGGSFGPRSQYFSRVYRPPQARSSHILQVNLYALLIEKNAAYLKVSHPVRDAQIVYLGPKGPIRCEAALNRETAIAFLQFRLKSLLTNDLPPILDEVDELWRCDYCPVRAECEQAHGRPVGKASPADEE